MWGWIAFVIMLIVFLMYRIRMTSYCRLSRWLMEIANNRINDLSTELTTVRKEKRKAIETVFRIERAMSAIRMASVRKNESLKWEIHDDALNVHDQTGEGRELLKGPCNG